MAPLEASDAPWWESFIKDFEREHPKANIEFTKLSTEESDAKILSAFSTGNEPDVFDTIPGEPLNKYVRRGKIAPLNELMDLGRFSPASLRPFTGEGGNVYGMPTQVFVIPLWYNKALFREHGVTAPATWDELLATCKQLSASGVTPIAFGNAGLDSWTGQYYFEPLLHQYDGLDVVIDATFGRGGASWSGPEVVNAATRIREAVDAGCFPKGFSGLNYSQMTSLFLVGKAAMINDGSWLSSELAAGSKVDAGVFPFPDVSDAARSTAELEVMPGGSYGLAASRKAAGRNPNLVGAFFDAFGAAADDYATKTGQLSAAADARPPRDPLRLELSSLLHEAGELGAGVDAVVPTALHDDYFQNLYALFTGDLSAKEFGDAMSKAVEAEEANLPGSDAKHGG